MRRPDTLFIREMTGRFLLFGGLIRSERRKRARISADWRKFPVNRNREWYWAEQGRTFRRTGNQDSPNWLRPAKAESGCWLWNFQRRFLSDDCAAWLIVSSSRSNLQTNTAPASGTGSSFRYQNNPERLQRRDQFHQGIHIAPDHIVAGFHALNRRHRQTRFLGEFALIDAGKGAGGTHLSSGYQGAWLSADNPLIIAYKVALLMFIKQVLMFQA